MTNSLVHRGCLSFSTQVKDKGQPRMFTQVMAYAWRVNHNGNAQGA
jgi:hypothetical protein